MRSLAVFLLLATPLGAQSQSIAPAPSRLFATPSVEPTGTADSAGAVRPTPKGAIVGFLVGAGLGWAILGSNGGCETGDLAGGGGGECGQRETMPRVLGAVIGAFAGVIIGSIIAGPDTPKPE